MENAFAADILENLHHLPKLGTPGTLIVHGEQAKAVLVGDNVSDVVIGAAELGQGRIVVITHEAYLKGFKNSSHEDKEVSTLQSNIRDWVTGSLLESDDDIMLLNRSRDVNKLGGNNARMALVKVSNQKFSVEDEKQVQEFVEKGGGLVYGICPWGFLQINPDLSVDDVPLCSLLMKAGFHFTEDYLPGNVEGFNIPGAHVPETPEAHVPETPEAHVPETPEAHVPETPEAHIPELSLEHKEPGWSEAILKNLTHLPKMGTPGTIVVYGEQARPIVIGDKKTDVLMAASDLGHGRVVAMAHEEYLKGFKVPRHEDDQVNVLQANIKEWVSRGQYDNDDDIMELSGWKDVEKLREGDAKIALMLVKDQKFTIDHVEEVVRFVAKGGGLVYGICPWGFLQIHPDYDEDDIPLYGLLEQAGIHFTGNYISGNDDGFKIPCSDGSDSHVLTLIKRCLESSEELCQNAQVLSSLLDKLPVKTICTLFEEKLIQLSESEHFKVDPPSDGNPLTSQDAKGLLLLSCTIAKITQRKAPGIEHFPGDFPSIPEVKCINLELHSTRHDIFPGTVYLSAGSEVELCIKEGSTNVRKWKVWIGAHSDDLTNLEEWKRLPKIHISRRLRKGKNIGSSPYGGSVYFESPSKESRLVLTMANVVENPFYDLKDNTSCKAWEKNRHAPGLWCDLVGKHVMITMPSESIRDVDNPAEAIKFWDSIVAAHHKLRTTDVSQHRKEWIVCDAQPVAGYMHAGYPIVTRMDISKPNTDKFILNVDSLKTKGNWGLYHELGHNMQRPEWTFAGTGEVTVNIFTLHAMDTVNGIKVWIHPWLDNQMLNIRRYLLHGANFEVWKKDPGVALGIYAQLAHHLGWGTYKSVFRAYEQLPENQKPTTDEAKMETWIHLFSEHCGQNLCPLFSFWGFSISEDLRKKMEDAELPHFLPMDEMSTFALERIANTVAEFQMDVGCMDAVPSVLSTCTAS